MRKSKEAHNNIFLFKMYFKKLYFWIQNNRGPFTSVNTVNHEKFIKIQNIQI